jgi:mono/diheme cytochrome c family protein
MNERVVRQVVFLLVAVFALAALGFALVPQRSVPSGDAGAAAWARHCARCHADDEFLPTLRAGDGVASAAALVERLGTHGDAPLAEDLLVVQWLVTQARGSAAAPAAADEADTPEDFTL